MSYVFVMKGVAKYVGNKQILKETWLSFLPGAKIGIIGPNGSGKSTLLRIMAGIDKDFHGEAWAMSGMKIGYMPQEPTLDDSKNVRENILQGLEHKQTLLQQFNEISDKFSEITDADEINALLEKQTKLQEEIEACNAWGLDHDVEIAMAALCCPDAEADVSKISGGERRRVALCKLLLSEPDILLLDEPTNHLDAESVAWLEHYLKNYKGTVVSITHDRYFLDNVAEWILEIDRGVCVPWHSNYSSWLEQKQKKLVQEEKSDLELTRQLKHELEWIRQPAKARQAKSKARINAYNELLDKQHAKVINTPQIIIPNGPRLGGLVIEVNNLSKSFGGKVLFENLSFKVPPGAVVGIIGPNGVGKTTLFNIITGRESPDSGEVKIGSTVKLGYVDQTRDKLNDNKTVWEEISDNLEEIYMEDRVVKSRAYCAAFNFRGPDQQKLVGSLSGGERNRVHMAKLLKTCANVLLLDEPSNDLDVDTLRALEEAVEDFAGCIFVISHDRWFLDRIATHIISFDGSSVTWFEGNYQDYHEYLERTGALTTSTKRHKKFSLN